MKQRIPAKIIEGKPDLTDWNRKNLNNLMASLEGKDVWISIEKQTKQRSNPQNRYLWGVVYKYIAEETDMDTESIHHFCKSEFLAENPVKRLPIPKVKSTKKLNTAEFNTFIGDILKWAAEFLNLYIPLPSEEEMWGGLLNDK